MKPVEKKIRITLIFDEAMADMINEAARKYGIPKTSYIKLATSEKIRRDEII